MLLPLLREPRRQSPAPVSCHHSGVSSVSVTFLPFVFLSFRCACECCEYFKGQRDWLVYVGTGSAARSPEVPAGDQRLIAQLGPRSAARRSRLVSCWSSSTALVSISVGSCWH